MSLFRQKKKKKKCLNAFIENNRSRKKKKLAQSIWRIQLQLLLHSISIFTRTTINISEIFSNRWRCTWNSAKRKKPIRHIMCMYAKRRKINIQNWFRIRPGPYTTVMPTVLIDITITILRFYKFEGCEIWKKAFWYWLEYVRCT